MESQLGQQPGLPGSGKKLAYRVGLRGRKQAGCRVTRKHTSPLRIWEKKNHCRRGSGTRSRATVSRLRALATDGFFEQENAELRLDTTPRYETAQDNAVLGALRVPVGAWDRNVFWVTNYHGSLSIWLKRKTPKQIWSAIEPLSYALTPALFLRDMLARAALPRLPAGLTIECCNGFSDRFDEFWQELKDENPNLLLAVRTRKVLEWHFAHALLQNRLWIWTVKQDSHMVAYAIFLKTEDSKFGITRVSVVDFQARRGDAALLLPMLSVALQRCKRERAHLLENVGYSFEKSGINNLAPYHKKGSWWTYYYKARDKDLAEILSRPSVWTPSLYDGDASIL